MAELQALFQRRRTQFERDVALAPDVKAAYDACMRHLGDVRRDHLDGAPDPELRRRMGELFAAAEDGVALMVAVSQVDIRMGLPNRINAPARRSRLSLKACLPYLPGALCALLGAWLYLDGATPAAILAILSGATSVLTLRRMRPAPRRAVPDVEGYARVDPVELGRRMDNLLSRMDELLFVRPADAEDSPLLLTGELMESVQMLIEARITEDGAFALKALPRMMAALEGQGIEIEMYEQVAMADFDLLPAPVGGETIRPALRKDGRLLLRGQATIKG